MEVIMGSVATLFFRPDWSHDITNYLGVNNGWVKIAEGKDKN